MNLNPEHGVAVFTDGSASSKDKTGGWAWVALDAFGGTHSNSGAQGDTTISQMELTAPTQALVALYEAMEGIEVLVYSDSEYVVKGFTDKTRKRNKNVEYWDALEEAAAKHIYVEMNHVKGHNDHEWNELADKLAGEARKKIVNL